MNEQLRDADSAVAGVPEVTPVQPSSTNDEWAAKYREASERDRRFTRLVHASVAVLIAAITGFLALHGAVGAAVRFMFVAPIVYLIIWTIVGLYLQWRREMGVNGP